MPFAATPPACAKSPAAYKAGPLPSSYTARAFTQQANSSIIGRRDQCGVHCALAAAPPAAATRPAATRRAPRFVADMVFPPLQLYGHEMRDASAKSGHGPGDTGPEFQGPE